VAGPLENVTYFFPYGGSDFKSQTRLDSATGVPPKLINFQWILVRRRRGTTFSGAETSLR